MSEYNDCRFKKDRIALLREKLANNPQWAMRGCTAIYAFQTPEEQAQADTYEDNGVGFNGCDAEILSSFAVQINEKRFAASEKQMRILFKKMPKYAKQLDGIAQSKVAA
jgi:hypothetical protein